MGQGIIAEQDQGLVGRNPAQCQSEQDRAHGIQGPLGAAEEAMEDREVALAHRARGQGHTGNGMAAQAMHPAGHQTREVAVTGGGEALLKSEQQDDEGLG